MACTCASTRNIIRENLANWKENLIENVQVTNIDTTITPLVTSTIARSLINMGEPNACNIACQQFGIRITADVQYYENEMLCNAKLTKPARYESRLSLNEISCQ